MTASDGVEDLSSCLDGESAVNAADREVATGLLRLDSDPRFCFAYAVPKARQAGSLELLVTVHGSNRDYLAARDAFGSLVRARNLAVLSPLFPVGVTEPGYGDGYKFLGEPGIDYIEILDAMIAQLRTKTDVAAADRFFLFGFSGGAQFAQRFALFEARRLAGLVISAPGSVTLPDENLDWWPGLRGAAANVGRSLDVSSLLRLPIAVTVGGADHSAGLVVRSPGGRNGSEHADIAGKTRIERARALFEALRAKSETVTFEILPDVGHELGPNAEAAVRIIEGWLSSPQRELYSGEGRQ